MAFMLVVFLSFWGAVANTAFKDLILEPDKPLVRAVPSSEVTIQCCYRWNDKSGVTWIKHICTTSGTTSSNVTQPSHSKMEDGVRCHSLFFKSINVNDTGLYQCKLTSGTFHIFTHGTYLQVYIPLEKALNLSESVKNSIITAEGVLLLICVLIPGTMVLCKSKRLNELQRKKEREEENIYEGLNLDDCNSAYHQIQRTNQQGPYQDVANCAEDIQLEKP